MNTLTRLRRELGHGGTIPSGWRLAWYEPRRRVGVYFPAPLHWAARMAREFTYRVRLALRAPGIECAQVFELQRAHRRRQDFAEEYARGYMAGWHECFDACLNAVEEEMGRPGDAWDFGKLLTDNPNPGHKN